MTQTMDQAIRLEDAEHNLIKVNGDLSFLHDQELLTDAEYTDKVKLTFQLFLKKVVQTIGEEACLEKYDYLPGQEIGFLNGKMAARA